MKNNSLKVEVICPRCLRTLDASDNSLRCPGCTREFKVIEEIPIMLGPNIPAHLEHQIKYFTKEKITSTDDYRLDPWQKSYVNRFLDQFPNIDGKLILDAGAGSGYMTVELAKRGAKVVSVDLTLNSLIRLKKIVKDKGLEDRVLFACCDVQELPFEENTFDYYISNAVLEHLPNEKLAIDEMNRVSKKDAGVLIAVPILEKYLHKLLLPLNLIHDKNIGHLRRYDSTTLSKKLSGWKLKKVYYTGHFKKVMKTIFNNFIFKLFDEEKIEVEDSKLSHNPRHSSNIVAIFERTTV